MKRKWNANGNLTDLYYWNETLRGYGWRLPDDKYLVYSDDSFVVDDVKLAIFVPINKSEDIFAGSYFEIVGLVQEIHAVHVEITSTKDDCILNLKWKLGGKKHTIILLLCFSHTLTIKM